MVALAMAMPRPWALGDRLGLVVIGLVVAGVLHLLARSRVTADDRGLTVVNGLRIHEVEWGEILAVTMTDGAARPPPHPAGRSTPGAPGIPARDGQRAPP